ncbi:unnamed protein product [Rotaria magnacalcarata]|uniref:G-protein coupled receptors family 1 profile domain-containing protein n=2 Tax=Rotaria magnacalcarata TaxID=392030 RepID=A0A814LKB4_9BILA|nr:unnamed protein product [Rotaria magnacalcarata]CAF1657908.1 unnamed protein product [Rotaria magnacalcarata]CAF4822089.1 unnamed protein product [Rotaria magnacalcarata]CAF5113349.1 unnamed protein product [Rotaria magnacalcarata]
MNPVNTVIATIGALVYTAGFIGNFFSLLLFTQKELRQVSTGLLFLLLSITNTIHLLSLLFEFIDSLFIFPVFPSDVFRCQFVLWLQNSTRTICSLLATTISIDRFLRSEYPIRSRIWCTPKNVLKLSIIYVIFSMLLYALFFNPFNIYDKYGFCSFNLNDTLNILVMYVMPPIRFVIICLIPVSIMIVCSCRMLFNIRKSRKRVAPQTVACEPSIAITVIPISKLATTNVIHRQRSVLTTDRTLLLMVSINVMAYTVTQLPFNIYAICYGYEQSKNDEKNATTRSYLLMWSAVYFAFGFYLYCSASLQFRKQFVTKIKNLVLHRRLSERTNSTTRNN